MNNPALINSGTEQFPFDSKGKAQSLTIEQCRSIMGWNNKSDEEIQEFLDSLQTWIDQFYDNHIYSNNL